MDVWRLVTEKIASLEELKTSWTLDDVDRAVAILNMKSSIEQSVDKVLKARTKKV